MSQIKEPFFNGEWIRNIYPITPPLSVYFRISKCGKYRQYQLRYNDSIMNGNFVPFPNDKDYRDMEKISLEIYHKQKQKKIERQSLILVISKIRNECGYMPRISMKLTEMLHSKKKIEFVMECLNKHKNYTLNVLNAVTGNPFPLQSSFKIKPDENICMFLYKFAKANELFGKFNRINLYIYRGQEIDIYHFCMIKQAFISNNEIDIEHNKLVISDLFNKCQYVYLLPFNKVL